MCEFIATDYVTPGYGCCHCGTYNGLQRRYCKACGKAPCNFDIPANVKLCQTCKFGLTLEEWKGQDEVCPSCGTLRIGDTEDISWQ